MKNIHNILRIDKKISDVPRNLKYIGPKNVGFVGKQDIFRAYSGSEFVVVNTLATLEKVGAK